MYAKPAPNPSKIAVDAYSKHIIHKQYFTVSLLHILNKLRLKYMYKKTKFASSSNLRKCTNIEEEQIRYCF